MGDQYVPSDATFHASVFVPDDADPPEMAVFNPPIEAALDNTAWLKKRHLELADLVGSVRAGFLRKSASTLATHVKWVPAIRAWWAVGSGGNDRITATGNPLEWPGVTVLTGPTSSATVVWGLACNAAGVVVAVSRDFDFVWKIDGGITTLASGVIGYDITRPAVAQINGKWVVAGNAGAGVLRVMVSTNPTVSWAAAAVPPASMPVGDVAIGEQTDARVLMAATSGTDLYTSMSADGDTWGASVVTPLGFTPSYGPAGTRIPTPVWTGTQWVVAVPDVTNSTTAIYAGSPDAATWTLLASLTSIAISYIAAIGSVICGASIGGDVVLSLDGGTTWQWADQQLESTIMGVYASSTRFLITQNAATGDVYSSIAMGDAGAVL